MIKKEYDILKKKYDLPNFKELDKEFNINDVEKKFLSRNLREKIVEKLDEFTKIIGQLLEPEQSIQTLHELRMMDDITKNETFKQYSELMILLREHQLVSLENDEIKDCEFIKKVWKKLPTIKKNLKKIIGIMKTAWADKNEVKETLTYLG